MIIKGAKSGPDRVLVMRQALDAFADKPLVWGERDCGQLAAFVARARGHAVDMARFGRYRSERGARRALARAGFDDLPAVIEAHGLARMAAAFALPADIVAFPDPQGGMTALAAYMGNGLVLGPHEASGLFRVLRPAFVAGGRQAWAYRT